MMINPATMVDLTASSPELQFELAKDGIYSNQAP